MGPPHTYTQIHTLISWLSPSPTQTRALSAALKEGGMHWRFELMTARALASMIRPDAPPTIDLEWSAPGHGGHRQQRVLSGCGVTQVL
jgi:hypothetical protein